MTTLTTLTTSELNMLVCFYTISVDCCGRCNDEENMSWANARDLQDDLGGSLQSIGGVMASLSNKGYITDQLESARGASINDFTLHTGCEVMDQIEAEYNRREA
jgi:hypothetical protein